MHCPSACAVHLVCAGGKVYITGFTGSIHCPAAESFCAMETVTGIKYPEQNFVYEAVFWGEATPSS